MILEVYDFHIEIEHEEVARKFVSVLEQLADHLSVNGHYRLTTNLDDARPNAKHDETETN